MPDVSWPAARWSWSSVAIRKGRREGVGGGGVERARGVCNWV